MTVKELIDRLSNFDPDIEVWVHEDPGYHNIQELKAKGIYTARWQRKGKDYRDWAPCNKGEKPDLLFIDFNWGD